MGTRDDERRTCRRGHPRVGRPNAGARDPDGRLRASAHRRSTDRQRRGGPRGLAHLALSVPVVPSNGSPGSSAAGRPISRAIGPAIGACCYEVGEDVRARFQEAAFASPQMARWFMVDPRSSPSNPSMPSLPSSRRANHWFFDGWQAVRDQLNRRACPRSGMGRRRVHGQPCRRVLFVPAGRRGGWTHGGDHQVSASSIAVFASRSACALSARPTCSNVTRPISCASSRAFACSGCRPAFFTL